MIKSFQQLPGLTEACINISITMVNINVRTQRWSMKQYKPALPPNTQACIFFQTLLLFQFA